MTRDEIVSRLKHSEQDLRNRGVAHAALFGSRARSDAGFNSDTDILIEIDPSAQIGIWDYAGLKIYVSSLFDGPVDVVERASLRPAVSATATVDAIYAF